MRALPTKIWQQFQLAVAGLSDEAPLRKVLEVVLLWVRVNCKYLTDEPFSMYGFDEIAKIDEEAMPVECSSFKAGDLRNFKSVVQRRQGRDVEAIARFVRDTVEELVTIEVDQQCPKCGAEVMRVFVGRKNGLLAYQCSVCGYAYYSDGSRVEGGGLEFAHERQLRELGLI